MSLLKHTSRVSLDSFSISVGAVRHRGLPTPWGTNPHSKMAEWRDTVSQYHCLMWHHSQFQSKTWSHAEQLPALWQAWDVRAEFWGEACTEYHLKHTHTASNCGPRRWYLPTNALMGLWEKASGYQTTQWLEGHNLSFRDALLQWCVTRSTSGRNVTTTLEHLRNDRTSIYSLNTLQKKEYCLCSLSVNVITNGSSGPSEP